MFIPLLTPWETAAGGELPEQRHAQSSRHGRRPSITPISVPCYLPPQAENKTKCPQRSGYPYQCSYSFFKNRLQKNIHTYLSTMSGHHSTFPGNRVVLTNISFYFARSSLHLPWQQGEVLTNISFYFARSSLHLPWQQGEVLTTAAFTSR